MDRHVRQHAETHSGADSLPRATTRKRRRPGRSQSHSDASSCDEQEPPRNGTRRRAPIACRVCRSRKVKCSNERPACAGCIRLGCECVYPDAFKNLQLDAQTGLILGALQEILSRLPPTSSLSASQPFVHPDSERLHAVHTDTFHSISNTSPSPQAHDNVLRQTSNNVSLDYVFQWPIFPRDTAGLFAADNILVADQEDKDDAHRDVDRASRLKVQHIEEDEIYGLVQNFLQHVHVKNPVLDEKTLLGYARSVAELGPQWDAKTCLVLVTAALGAIAKPFTPTLETTESLSTLQRKALDEPLFRKADAYYQSAQRRFGLLDRSLTACHCYLVSGIFLLYSLRPLEAWQSFFNASSIYTVYLRGRIASQGLEHYDPSSQDAFRCRLEQRLYWSCIKSETEIGSEITLPRSSLASIDYPYMFPSPPPPEDSDEMSTANMGEVYPRMPTSTSTISPGSHDGADQASLHEQSWFYYLSEIAMLRISSRINHTFYAGDHTTWLGMDIPAMVDAARDLECQLEQWRESLPQVISCFDVPPELETITELQLTTWTRYSSLKAKLYRPFLYRLAHLPNQGFLSQAQGILQPLAEKAVLECLDPLRAVGMGHRHAGAWYRCRESAARALSLLCGLRIGLVKTMGKEEEATSAVELCLAQLRCWEDESSDLKLAREVIESLYSQWLNGLWSSY
ncbi:hypothetical protein CEP52_008589 [Fusarium oligoseptatum]|uniref:Zn(2)-C6 fungal-type domain-containing protein n=1 Tax=Fusarium oligoseptatum TaxID=2604345 RepID=A0A428TH41_9HYPO|nr:hypothetical protein CEP52_008589 [Fusarium oligoseptatum]